MVSLLFMQILKYTFDFPVVAMVSCIPVKRCWVGTTYCQLGKARGNGMKVFGERLARLPRGHSSLRTDRRATCPSRATNSQDLRSTMLATTRNLVFKLATARVFFFFFVPHRPPLSRLLRPHCQLGINRCQRSQATRAAALPPPPPIVETSMMVD